MSNKNYLNKNSQYVDALVSFINDTKPYHSKLTEIAEEYRFTSSTAGDGSDISEMLNVAISESLTLKVKQNPTWLFNYFSGGSAAFRSFPVKHLELQATPPAIVPAYTLDSTSGLYKPGDVEDLLNLPFVYSKKAFDGAGVADLMIDRFSTHTIFEPLIEGVDFFQNLGSTQIRIVQINTQAQVGLPAVFAPRWQDVRNDLLIPTASRATQILAMDLQYDEENDAWIPNDPPRPEAASNQLRVFINRIRNIDNLPFDIVVEIDLLLDILNGYTDIDGVYHSPTLPRDYEALLVALEAASIPTIINLDTLQPYTAWTGLDTATEKYVSAHLASLTPLLYFSSAAGDVVNAYNGNVVQESGKAQYPSVSIPSLEIKNIIPTSLAQAGDTWQVRINGFSLFVWDVFSSISGYIGSFTTNPSAPVNFYSSTVSFRATYLQDPEPNDVVNIRNKNKIVIGPDALIEVWNIIKVNPITYSRPVLKSTRYGHLVDLNGNIGNVTILVDDFIADTIILTAQADGTTFKLSSVNQPSYMADIQVGQLYNDGKLGFTIRNGFSAAFSEGDKFYINIKNDPPKIIDLDLGYGYDLDSYDASTLVYNNSGVGADQNVPLNFVFDTRFVDYDFSAFNIAVTQLAHTGRQWRLKAVPNISRPIATLKKDGSGLSNNVDLQETTSGLNGDPALNAAPLYSMLGDANPAPDLKLFYADSFTLEYSDNGFNTTTVVDTINVGDSYSSLIHGISFTLAPGTKPFIAVQSDDGLANPAIEGGDVFSFRIENNPPEITEAPIGIISSAAPRLIMHGSGFHYSLPAKWTVKFSSASDFVVSGIQTGAAKGAPVPGSPFAAKLLMDGTSQSEGFSFNNLGVHFTIKPGVAGLHDGDEFAFNTFESKPTYLVYGSASGWAGTAEIGKPYWNGKIGFEILPPAAKLFDITRTRTLVGGAIIADYLLQPISNNVWTVSDGTFTVSRIRKDASPTIYTLTPTPIGSLTPTGWFVSNSDATSLGYLAAGGTFNDDFITISNTVGIVTAATLKLEIVCDDLVNWNAPDTVILKPALDVRLPTVDDSIFIDKRVKDFLGINLRVGNTVSQPSLAPLAPLNIDPRFIDTYTGSISRPLSSTSPETAILDNWIPLTIKPLDSTISIAEFSDRPSMHDVFAAASGEKIGRLFDRVQNTPPQFEWDLTFFGKYLPLNAESNLVTYGNGFNDIVRTRITEEIKLLISGGALTTNFLFSDDITVGLSENETRINIKSTHNENIVVQLQDGPFTNFIGGYDNFPFDEDPFGFDTGVPLLDHFTEAQQLGGILPLTPAQQLMSAQDRTKRLNALTATLGSFLNGPDISSTTLAQFMALYEADPSKNAIATTGNGIPAVGLGIDIVIGSTGQDVRNPSTDGTSASIQDVSVMLSAELDVGYDSEPYDRNYDSSANSTAVFTTTALPPIPNPLVLTATYEDFETPFLVAPDDQNPLSVFEARIFSIKFVVTATNVSTIRNMAKPKVFVWLPLESQPIRMPVVDKVGIGHYNVSIPVASEAKIYIQAGP